MNETQSPISVITDISATVFSVFIIILIVLLALPPAKPVPAEPVRPIDARADLVATARRPLSANDLVRLLFERRSAARRLRIDLFADRFVAVQSDDPPIELPLPLTERSRTALTTLLAQSGSAPVALYVFDHAGYAELVTLIGGRPFLELSVPIALRGTVEQRQDWREGFRRLIDTATDLDAFRDNLARLLDVPDPEAVERPSKFGSNRSGRASAAANVPPAEGLLDRLALWLQRAIAIGAVGLCIGLISWVEWMRPRPKSR